MVWNVYNQPFFSLFFRFCLCVFRFSLNNKRALARTF